MPPTPKLKAIKRNNQQLIVFEGFRLNRFQIRNQRIILHVMACVNIDFGDIRTQMTNNDTLGLRTNKNGAVQTLGV